VRRVLRGGSIEIYTSHWRSSLLKDVDAQIVSISRGEPRWRLPFAYRRVRELAPDDRTWRQNGEEEFTAAYLDQLNRIGADTILERLEKEVDGGRPCVLLCWEKPHEPFCHRWLLARYIEREPGIVVPELQPGMLSRRATTQPPLFDERGGA
jgi:hypothetical protein